MNAFQAWLDRDLRRSLLLALLALAALSALVLFQQLGGLGLMDKTEGLFVEVPRQMLLSGDWITPRWNGDTFFDYPVWGYWMVGLSFRLFGISEWAARLPAALAAAATAYGLFALLFLVAPPEEAPHRRIGRATLGATVLLLSPGWVGWGRSSVTDMFLASGISLALLGFGLAHGRSDRPQLQKLGYSLLALFCGVAVLAKGPVGVLLPGLVIIGFLLLKGSLLAQLRRTPWLPMLALFFGVVAPWYSLATAANGPTFLARFLGFSNLERFTSVLYDHPGPPWFYLPWLLLLLLPWSLYLPLAMARLRFWRLDAWRRSSAPADLSLLALLWLVLMVAFFSAAATKLPGYILPALPGAVLLVTLLFVPFEGASTGTATGTATAVRGLRWSGGLNALLLALMAVAAVLTPRWLEQDPSYPGFATALAGSGVPWLAGLPLLLAALALLALLLRPQAPALQWLWLPNAAGFAALLALVVPVLVPLMDRERQLPIRELARLAAAQARPDEPLLVAGYKRYSVVFYSGRPVLFVSSPRRARRQLAQQGFSDRAGSVLLLGNDSELLEFGLGPSDGILIERRDAHRLVRLPLQQLQQLGR